MKKDSFFKYFMIFSFILEASIIIFFHIKDTNSLKIECKDSIFTKTVQAQRFNLKLTVSNDIMQRQYLANIDQKKHKQQIWIDDSAQYIIDYQKGQVENNGHFFSTDSIADIRDILFLIIDYQTSKKQINETTWLYEISKEALEESFFEKITDLNNPYIGYNIFSIESISPIEIIVSDGYIKNIKLKINDVQLYYEFSNYNQKHLEEEKHEVPKKEPIITAVYNHYEVNFLNTIL